MLSSSKNEYGNVENGSTKIDAQLNLNPMHIESASWRFEDLNRTIKDIRNNTNKYIVSDLSLVVWDMSFDDRGIISLAIRTDGGTAELRVALKVYGKQVKTNKNYAK